MSIFYIQFSHSKITHFLKTILADTITVLDVPIYKNAIVLVSFACVNIKRNEKGKKVRKKEIKKERKFLSTLDYVLC